VAEGETGGGLDGVTLQEDVGTFVGGEVTWLGKDEVGRLGI